MELEQELIEALILHLRQLKARGTRYVAVSPDVLNGLGGGGRTPVGAARSVPRPAAGRQPQPLAAPQPRTVTARPSPAIPQPGPKPAAVVAPAAAPAVPPASPAPAVVPVQSKSAALAELRQRVLNCTRCPNLVAARNSVVFGVGNPEASLMFVGEAPGADEDLQGEPFVGKAGQLLTKIIQTMGLSRDSVYIGNILKCRPDMPPGSSGNRKPTPDEMQTCVSYLQEQIDIIRPKVLVALGATAVEGLLGKTEGITRLRGHWREYRGIPLMPTYHPAYLLRNQALSEKRRVWEDMLQVMERLGLPISEKQRNFFLKQQGAA